MMSRVVFVLVIAFAVTAVNGTFCSLDSNPDFIDKITKNCPGLLDSSDKSYCCPDLERQKFYCCDAPEFALKAGLTILLPVVLIIVVIVTIFLCCISCICCSCCPWYKRRHRGIVYGKVHRGRVIEAINQQNSQPENRPIQSAQPSFPIQQAPTASYEIQPPPYTMEAYSKQAPYNPDYVA